MPYKTDMYFLNRVEPKGPGMVTLSLFLDAEGNILVPKEMREIHYGPDKVIGKFKEEDYSNKPHRIVPSDFMGLTTHLPNHVIFVVEFGTGQIFFMTQAPKDGYYAEIDIDYSVKREDKEVFSIDGAQIITDFSEPKQEDETLHDVYRISPRNFRFLKLNEPDIRELSEDESFELGGQLLTPESESILTDWVVAYDILKPFSFNRAVVEESLKKVKSHPGS